MASGESEQHQHPPASTLLQAARKRVSKLDEREEAVPKTDPIDLEALKKDELRARSAYIRTRRESGPLPRAAAYALWKSSRLARTRLVRTLNLFFFHYGTVMAAGAAYMMFFSIAAVLFAGFGIVGLIIGRNEEYQELILRGVGNAVPGVIDTGAGGLFTPAELFDTTGLNLAVTISLAAAVVTSLSWMHGLRAGIRSIWDRPLMAENVILVKIRDLGIMIVLVAVVLSSAVLGVISHGFIDEIFDLVGWEAGGAAYWLSRIVSLVIVFGLDMVVAFLLMRVASRLVIPVGALWQSMLIAGVGASLLRLGATEFLSMGGGENPLLDGFGSVLGLFFYFYLFSLVYLLAASWGAVAAAEHAERQWGSAARKP
ncbi:YihY/virulence factor BrkB family protein [Nesterenkonia populi]|uniref:YihY/virulence factor BrkB family protein n=1 Tax=Nesterenkonia populi TaxID=1591087 RepID=UPI0011BF9C61|nr:YhjD/YihY/BrkB family envelope integrity protein [Nesterenkonia populi]